MTTNDELNFDVIVATAPDRCPMKTTLSTYLDLPHGVAFSWAMAQRLASSAAAKHHWRYRVHQSSLDGRTWCYAPIWTEVEP